MATNGVNFGELEQYSGSTFIPAGKYCVYHNVVLHQAVDKTTQAPKGPPRLGVMIDFYPLANPVEEAKIQQFYSMGSKAHLTYAPNPDTGKGVVLVPGGPQSNLNDKTNWFFYLDSLYQSAMPKGVFTNDLTTIDGVWVTITHVPEPAERAGFRSNTAEVQQEERKPGLIAVVSQIEEGGAPWEGGGGFPAAPVAAAAPAPRAVAARPGPPSARPNGAPAPATKAPAAPRPAARPVAAVAPPPPAQVSGLDPEDIKAWASTAINESIVKKPNGLPKTILRNETFKYLEKEAGAEVAGAVITSFFEAGGEANLMTVLGELGYTAQGPQVKPLA